MENYAERHDDDVIQIIPGDGWSATFKLDGDEDGFSLPLVAWGVRRDGQVVPLVCCGAEVNEAGEVTGFVDVVPGGTP